MATQHTITMNRSRSLFTPTRSVSEDDSTRHFSSSSLTLRVCVGGSLFILLALVLAPAICSADELFPPELTKFEPIALNPVFTARGEGHWDVKHRERGWIVREGDLWRMWFTGYDGTKTGQRQLGYATSRDGLAWQPHPANPLCKQHWVEDVCVIPHEGTLHMFAEGEQDRAQLLASRDGLDWQRIGKLDVRHVSGEPISDGPYGTPTVWLENGVWNLFYERSDKGIWLARSRDLKVFTHVQDEPVMVPGPDEFDRDLIAMNQIIKHKGRYYAVIHGTKNNADPTQPNQWATGLAVSSDLIHWTKFPGNPLRPISENKSSGLLIPDGDRFLLYTMHGKVEVHRSLHK